MSLPNRYNTVNADNRTGINLAMGVYEAVVMENKDSLLMGRLAVYIPELGGNINERQSWKTVRYASPFYGITPYRDSVLTTAQKEKEFNRDKQASAEEVNKTAKQSMQDSMVTSYGMWAVPPDLGVTVLVMFAGGDLNRGFWFACVPTLAHGMVPAIGAPDGKTPMAEFNPIDPKVPVTEDLTSIERQPYQPLVDQLTAQGIQEDPLRGPITSSSFREAPSNVFGISSKGGHTFVMDDGTADGTSKLIRFRTAGGNQITMHDDTGMIYMINAGGTGWLEISPSGQIDVFGAAGINMATPGDINLHADNNVSIHAGNCVKIVGINGTKVMGGSELQLHGAKTMIEGVDSLHVHSCKEMMFTSYADIHMKAFNYFCLKGKCFYWNSCTAKEAEQVPPEQPQDVSGYQTTVARAPNHEPYKEHDSGQGAGAGGGAGGMPGIGDTGGIGDMASNITGGLGSGTGPGGMFGGDRGGGRVGGGMDTAATSLGTNNFSLNFRTGLAGNTASSSTTASTSVTGGSTMATAASGASSGSTTTAAAANTRPASNAASTSLNMNAARPTTNNSITTTGNTGTTYTYRPATTTQAGPNGATVTTPASITTSDTYGGYSGIPTTSANTQTLTQQNAQQGQNVFNSGNPADQAMTGSSPAQAASHALSQLGGTAPSSDLPAAPGGGGTDCFAKGDNCQRPADETGGPSDGGPGGEDRSGQSAGDIPSDATDEDIAARTIAGECRGCSPEEQAAIGEVLRNRAAANGTSVAYEARRAAQFSTWNAGDPNRSYITNLSPSSSTYQQAASAYRASANTNYAYGATHYYNTRTASPAWGSRMTTTTTFNSGHRFGYIRGEYNK